MSEFLNDNEFERFLQQQVKHHRMYPSDAVWKGIYQQMHHDKKWPGLYFIAILIVAALSVCTVFMESTPIIYTQQTAQVVATAEVNVKHLDPVKATNETLKLIRDKQVVSQAPQIDPLVAVSEERADVTEEKTTYIAVVTDKISTSLPTVSGNNVAVATTETVTTDEPSPIAITNSISAAGVTQSPDVMKEATSEAPAQDVTAEKTATAENQVQEDVQMPVLVNNKKKRSKWQYEVYITPSTSYKRTVDEKPRQDQFSGPVNTNFGVDASQVIRYKPGMGIEFGLGAIYSVSKRFSIKTGFQYNVRQYNIEAYAGNYETTSISMLRYGHLSRVPVVSKFRASGASYDEALLLNKYHQVSLPVGLEYALINNSAFGVSIAAGIQPTYTFSQSSYLLTSDYKSYADGLSMIRRWNINSNLEATFSYRVGDFQWKFGPQFRYQHLPTYTSKYPIKEYLIDYGFKIGFAKTIQ